MWGLTHSLVWPSRASGFTQTPFASLAVKSRYSQVLQKFFCGGSVKTCAKSRENGVETLGECHRICELGHRQEYSQMITDRIRVLPIPPADIECKFGGRFARAFGPLDAGLCGGRIWFTMRFAENKMFATKTESGLSLAWYSSAVPVDVMTETGLDVAACVERVRQRDEDAARLLLNHLYPLVIKLVRAHLPRRTSEEDLAQTVFMKIFAKLDQYSGSVPLEHWVGRITINTCINQLASEKVRPELRWADLSEEQCEVLENLPSKAEALDAGDSLAAREIVEKLLAFLAPRDRMLMTLLYLDGHTPREVQKITGWSGTVIRGRAYYARLRLRKYFKELMSENRV